MGKTTLAGCSVESGRKHPHVHGEDPLKAFKDLLETKHPHVHGEDRFLGRTVEQVEETPPRAWGRPRKGRGKGR